MLIISILFIISIFSLYNICKIRKLYLSLQPQTRNNGAIAQLVEHNLAKVRVASSSLVFRSKQEGQCRDTLAFFIPCRESGIKNSQ